MAIPMLRASAPPGHLGALFHFNVKKPLHLQRLPCSPTELNPVLQTQTDEVRSESGLSLSVGTHLIPHPNKVDKGGEDAFLVSGCNGGVIAVADGVSGWAEQNVDPSLFSKELMAHALSLLGDEEVNYNPRMLLKEAHAATSSVGSATVVVAMLERDGILRIANVGDCGLRVVRGGQIIFSTSPQEHYFDCPYQLSSESVGQTYQDAVVSTVEVIEKDTVVMGSDGLFDNVFDHEIVSTLAKHGDVSEAAKAVADLAREHSADLSYDSPYSIEARTRGLDVPVWKKALGFKLTGGKLDDITVIVGRVVGPQESSDTR
ncbi:probable protein phosphatase 2C 26 isoform X1 [Eucalyptus grandis]|uniref:probable protein phosphatase 2C 26 isoform X1 n=2 Tax=Eucalyptus grandis TaxID=71139 RepID=UPI00192EFA7D|nr:probable protein phosphatase 2C 26 isoform X1 [Eucalyptus grandis]